MVLEFLPGASSSAAMASTKVLRQLLRVAPLQLLSADSALHVLSDSGDLEKKIEALSAQLSQLASASECCLNGRNVTNRSAVFLASSTGRFEACPCCWSRSRSNCMPLPVCRAQMFSVHLDLAACQNIFAFAVVSCPWSSTSGFHASPSFPCKEVLCPSSAGCNCICRHHRPVLHLKGSCTTGVNPW